MNYSIILLLGLLNNFCYGLLFEFLLLVGCLSFVCCLLFMIFMLGFAVSYVWEDGQAPF